MEETIEIKSMSGTLLFKHTCEDNSIKKTVEEAVRNNVSLRGANLCGANVYGADLRNAFLSRADMCGANLCGANLYGANLSVANLYNADMCGANLCGANLYGANLRNAFLSRADLCGANLSGADLRDAYLCGANLSVANLYNADMCGANLCGANLYGANLSVANLYNADLSDVKADQATAMFFPQCPDGEFVGYKKAGGKIVKLLIPADAKRSSGTTLKCRCSKATVLEVQELDGSTSEVKEVRSYFDNDFIYRVGETVFVEDFDDNRWNECTTGIHFFISRDAAVSYEG